MLVVIDELAIGEKFRMLAGELDERGLRLWAAAEATTLGRGGTAAVARATGIAPSTIGRGRGELARGESPGAGRVRRVGAGRKRLVEKDPSLLGDLERLVDVDARGDPEQPLRWTSKSLRNLALALREQGHEISARSVAPLLRQLGYSLQSNRKTKEGARHPDRDAQFRYISQQAAAGLAAGQPVISVDTKKKELVGDFKAVGRELAAKGSPVSVRTHDFIDKQLGKAVPYGVYDVGENAGLVSVGIDNDTAQFSVASIRAWWRQLGSARYPEATVLTITADCGGSNGNRTRLWKTELQGLADETGLAISVCHFPPGTSKWNKIEHRLFAHISLNWRGRPLTSHEVIVNTIAATTTSTGLAVHAELDTASYPTGVKITDQQMNALEDDGTLTRHDWHGDWNYTLNPKTARVEN